MGGLWCVKERVLNVSWREPVRFGLSEPVIRDNRDERLSRELCKEVGGVPSALQKLA